MTIQEALEVLKKREKCADIPLESPECNRQHTLCYGCKYEVSAEDLSKARTMEVASLEAWEAVEKEVDEIINRPYLNIMECVHALREIRDIIKTHLREVEE